MRDFLDPVPKSGGNAQVLQQSPNPAGEDQRFGIAWGRVLFVGLVFCVMVLWLLLFSRRVLSSWALRNHQLYLERFLFW
jgi:hypothetical protein